MSIKVRDLQPGSEIFTIDIISKVNKNIKETSENKKIFEVKTLIVDKIINAGDDKINLFIYCNNEAINYGVLNVYKGYLANFYYSEAETLNEIQLLKNLTNC